jgi:chitin synthase
MVNTFSGSGPAHAQPSLPSLPAHLQSDTHLTAHLASRYEAIFESPQLRTEGVNERMRGSPDVNY